VATDYEKIRAKLLERPVMIRGTRYYVAETDLLLDDAQVIGHAQMRAAARRQPDKPPPNHAFVGGRKRLLAISKQGRIVRWAQGFTLTYAIDASTCSNAEYETVRENMSEAAGEWSGACGIRFEHRDAQDHVAIAATREVVFTVSREDMRGELVAAAFFPTDPSNRRRVVIDPSYFSATLSYDPVGVLRHELGHVLGFRHEHIRAAAPPGCLYEELDDTKAVTAYDSQSVMHYLCGDAGSAGLELTDVDREGARAIYGAPYTQFEYVT
jgi:hypothetical protein